MDYEKAYNEALQRAKSIYRDAKSENCTHTDWLENIFPELKESEDERIRKELIRIFKSLGDGKIPVEINYADIFTWLEKQGSQNLANSAKTCKVEHNPAWSEEDEEMLNNCIEYTIRIVPVKAAEDSGLLVDFKRIPDEKAQDFLKSLKERCTWKPSDEQIMALKKACYEHWEPDGLDPLYTLYQDLKKLKG